MPGFVLAPVGFSRLLGQEALVLVVQRPLRTVEPAFSVLSILVCIPGIQTLEFRRNVRDGMVAFGPLSKMLVGQSNDVAGEDILRPFSGVGIAIVFLAVFLYVFMAEPGCPGYRNLGVRG